MNKRFRIIYFLVLILLFSRLLSQDLNQARRYESLGQLTLAKAIYQAYLNNHPFNPSVYNSYRRVTFSLSTYDEFLAFSLELLKRGPNNPEVLLSIGEAYLKLEKRKEGIDYLRRTFEQNPELVSRIGLVLMQEKLPREAINFILDYRKSKKDPHAHTQLLIELYEAINDYQKATREITQFLNMIPTQAPGYESKLKTFLFKTNPSLIFNELNNLTNKHLRTKLLAKLYLSQRRYKEALAEIKTLNSPAETYSFARYCEEQEDFQPAADLYHELGNLSDEARVLRKMGKIFEATEVLKRETGPDARLELAELQRLELKDNRAAKENYLLVLKQKPIDQAYYGLVASLISLGQLDEAQKYLTKMNKVTDRSLFFLIQIYFYESQFDSCKNYISELSRRFPASPFLNDALEIGVLLVEGAENLADFALVSFHLVLGNYDDGIALTKKLINQTDKVAEHSFLLLAELYLAKKEPNLALSALQELKVKFPTSRLLPKAKFEQAKIYSEKLKDQVKYQQTLEELIVEFPNSAYSSIARNILAKAQKPEPIH